MRAGGVRVATPFRIVEMESPPPATCRECAEMTLLTSFYPRSAKHPSTPRPRHILADGGSQATLPPLRHHIAPPHARMQPRCLWAACSPAHTAIASRPELRRIDAPHASSSVGWGAFVSPMASPMRCVMLRRRPPLGFAGSPAVAAEPPSMWSVAFASRSSPPPPNA